MMTETDTPRIYVASLADYNAGRLHGVWIDADQDAETIAEEIADMLAASPEPIAEDWAIHDHEGFAGLPVGEHESIEELAELARLLVEHGPALAAYVANNCGPAEGFEEAYQGSYDSEEAFAQELAEEIGALPADASWPGSYIDWERATSELFSGDYWSADDPSGGVFVFRSM